MIRSFSLCLRARSILIFNVQPTNREEKGEENSRKSTVCYRSNGAARIRRGQIRNLAEAARSRSVLIHSEKFNEKRRVYLHFPFLKQY